MVIAAATAILIAIRGGFPTLLILPVFASMHFCELAQVDSLTSFYCSTLAFQGLGRRFASLSDQSSGKQVLRVKSVAVS